MLRFKKIFATLVAALLAAGGGLAQTQINPNQIRGAAVLQSWSDPTVDYSASCSATTTTGTISTGTSSLVVASATGWRVGMGVGVVGAGVAAAELVTTVTAISGTTLTLNAAASTTATGQVVRHDDTVALNAAFAAAKNVLLPAGTCNVTGALTAGVSKIIAGAGMVGRTNASTGSALTNIIQFSPTADTITATVGYVELSGFSIQMATGITPTAGYALRVTTSGSTNDRGWKFHDILTYGTFGGLKVGTAASFGDFSNLFISVASASTENGIYYDNPSTAGDNRFHNIDIRVVIGGSAYNNGIRILNADVTEWSNIKVLSATKSIVITGASAQQRISNCSLENNSGANSHIDISGASVSNITIIGCELGVNGSGTGITIGATMGGAVSIIGNTFKSLSVGVNVGATTQQVSIIGNIFDVGVTTALTRAAGATNVALFGSATPFANLTYCSAYPCSRAAVITGATNTLVNSLAVENISTTTMADGFAAGVAFEVRDTDAVNNIIGQVAAIRSGADNTGDLALYSASAGTLADVLKVTSGKHLQTKGTAPALTSCGGSPSITGNDNAMTVTAGSAATGCTITFATTWTNTPHCTVTEQTGSVANALTYTVSTTAVTLAQTGLAANVIDIVCSGHY